MLQLVDAKTRLGDCLYNFNLSVAAGETVAIVGESGAGKSTLLNMISGFQPVQTGDIKWRGDTILNKLPSERPITNLFQTDNLFEHLSVGKNIGLGIDPGLSLNTLDWQRIEQVLASVGLEGMSDRQPSTLSGGEQQRVGLARCLIREQPIMLLDEPYSALDETTRGSMLELTDRLIQSSNLCTVMVSHDLDDAQALNATVWRLIDGELQLSH